MTDLQKLRKYEREQAYRATKKSVCMVFPKWCYDAIKEAAGIAGVSVTRFMVLASLRLVWDMKEHGVEYFDSIFGREGLYYVHYQDKTL